MTSFTIYQNTRGLFSFRYCLNTRLTLVMLFGSGNTGWEECLENIKHVQKQLSHPHYISFSTGYDGYSFKVISKSGQVLAYSRYFPTQKLMKRMLSIVQTHISFATIQRGIKTQHGVKPRDLISF